MEVVSVVDRKQSKVYHNSKSRSFISAKDKKAKESTLNNKQNNHKNNCFKILKPTEAWKDLEQFENKSNGPVTCDNYMTPFSYCEFSTNRKGRDASIVSLGLKECPNYHSIMDLWTNSAIISVSWRSQYFWFADSALHISWHEELQLKDSRYEKQCFQIKFAIFNFNKPEIHDI